MGGTTLPVGAFLINHPEGMLLFDTGPGRRVSTVRPAACSDSAPVLWRTRSSRSDVRPTDVNAVINCHLHYDHAGGNPLFPGVPIFVQAREYEAAGELAYLIAERIDFPGADLRLVHGEEEVMPGVRVIPTPGHTPGHQSLVIEDYSQDRWSWRGKQRTRWRSLSTPSASRRADTRRHGIRASS